MEIKDISFHDSSISDISMGGGSILLRFDHVIFNDEAECSFNVLMSDVMLIVRNEITTAKIMMEEKNSEVVNLQCTDARLSMSIRWENYEEKYRDYVQYHISFGHISVNRIVS